MEKATESQPTATTPSGSESKEPNANANANAVVESASSAAALAPEVKPAAKPVDLSSELEVENELDLDEVEEVGDKGEEKTAEEAEAEKAATDAKAAKEQADAQAAADKAKVDAAAADQQQKTATDAAKAVTEAGKQPSAAEPIPQAQNLQEVQEQFTKWRNESEILLAEHHYALPEAVVKEYEDEGVSSKLLKAIPRMMSRVYLDAVQATMGQIMTHLPTLMSQVTRAQNEGSQTEAKFYEQWPKLKEKPEYADTIRRIGTAYRQLNPRASSEDFIREVGAGAMIALRLPMETSAAATPTQPRSSFRPAAATRPASPTPSKPKNVFEAMAEETEEIDLDN
jgi:hypothetical protein